MEGTRVQTLADLEAWAHDPSAPKVYWLNGQLGTGKTSIAHTFCKRLDAKQMLGGSFFCSRSALTDVTRVIPTLAHMLALSNPNFQATLAEVLTRKPSVADHSSIVEQFGSLIVNPINLATDNEHNERGSNYVIVLDALDECSPSGMVQTFTLAYRRLKDIRL